MNQKKTSRTLKAAGGVVYRDFDTERQVLLIYRNDTWDLPKGKLEDDESIPGCAMREVMEEIGLNAEPRIEANLGTTTHSYIQDGEEIEKLTFWFVMTLEELPDTFVPQQEEGISDVKWTDAERAAWLVGYENLKDLMTRFLRRS